MRASSDEDGVIVAAAEPGVCRVVCFSPRHDLTLATMPAADVRAVVDTWVEEYLSLGSRPGISYVEIFENRGEMMGASNPHPHGQIWATHTIPDLPARELASAAAYRQATDRCLLCDYTALERQRGERMVSENETFVAVVPFWAVWPFELLVLSRRHVATIDRLTDAERDALADILRRVTTRYDNLFEAPFPYSMGFHQQPTRWIDARRQSPARALLSAPPALGHHPQVHGRLRAARDAAEGHHAGIRRRATARAVRGALLQLLTAALRRP